MIISKIIGVVKPSSHIAVTAGDTGTTVCRRQFIPSVNTLSLAACGTVKKVELCYYGTAGKAKI